MTALTDFRVGNNRCEALAYWAPGRISLTTNIAAEAVSSGHPSRSALTWTARGAAGRPATSGSRRAAIAASWFRLVLRGPARSRR